MHFQSPGSSTCALEATGNLLALYGIALTREEVRDIFGCSKKSPVRPIDHPTISRVLEKELSTKGLRWKRYPELSFERLHRAAEVLLASSSPTLMTFSIRHRSRSWRGIHCAVLFGVEESSIHLVDSLGRRNGRLPNATVTAEETTYGWRLVGAPAIATRGPFRLLEGLPRLSTMRPE